jgi:hypothetical protein
MQAAFVIFRSFICKFASMQFWIDIFIFLACFLIFKVIFWTFYVNLQMQSHFQETFYRLEQWFWTFFCTTMLIKANSQAIFRQNHHWKSRPSLGEPPKAVFFNLLGSKFLLKASFKTAVQVKEICQLFVAVMFAFVMYAFFPF